MKLCGFCREPIEGAERSPVRGAQPLHRECGLRLVIGSLAHLERRCGCYVEGSDASDPPHMTLRQAAQAACDLWALQQTRS